MRTVAALVCAAGIVVGDAAAVDIASGNASMNMLESVQLGMLYPFAAPLGDGAVRLDGPSSPDVLYKYCWYFRTPVSTQVRLLGSLLAPAQSVNGDTVTFTWLDNGDGAAGLGGRFDSTLTVTLVDGAGAGQGRVTSSLRIRNIGPSSTTLRFYHLVDLDLPGGSPNPAPDDTLSLASASPLQARYTETSTANYALVEAPAADRHRIDQGFALRSLLADATTVNLLAETGPYSGDGAVAFQWTVTLAPGEERVLDAAIGINMPASVPACRADFNGIGGVTVQDIFDFLVAYFANQASADINGQGGVTVQDVFDYLALYFAGCP